MSSPSPGRPPAVLFVCVHNGGKSQIAAGLMERSAGGDVVVTSAGTAPGTAVHPLSAESLLELGVDIRDRRPQALTPDLIAAADVVVVLGDEAEIDPAWQAAAAGTRFETWLPDEPSARGTEGLERMRLVRDDIAARVAELRGRLLAAG